jgi:hypothetical protein
MQLRDISPQHAATIAAMLGNDADLQRAIDAATAQCCTAKQARRALHRHIWQSIEHFEEVNEILRILYLYR